MSQLFILLSQQHTTSKAICHDVVKHYYVTYNYYYITLFALEGISQVFIFHTLISSCRMVSALTLTEPVQVLDVD